MPCAAFSGEHFTMNTWKEPRFGEHTEFFENYISFETGADIKPINTQYLNKLATR